MKVLDYTGKEFGEVTFGEETLIIMAHQRKILILDDHNEMWKLKHVMEVAEETLVYNEEGSEEEEQNYYKRTGALTCLVDDFEQESSFLEDKDEEPRNLKLIEDNEIEFDSKISIFYGYLNSADSFLEPEVYKIIAEELIHFVNTSGRCKESTIKLVNEFAHELLLEYVCYQSNKEIFKIKVTND